MKLKRLIQLANILYIISFFTLIGCNKVELDSKFRDQNITIDGLHTDWDGAMTIMKEKNLSIGLLNDKDFMYICMVTGDRSLRTQIIRSGFTLWFDSDGAKKKKFGIRFPFGMQEMGMMPMMGRRGNRSEQDMEKFGELFERSMNELEILNSDKEDGRRMFIAEAKGIDIKIGNSTGKFVYELKVPLSRSKQHPFAINAEAGDLIGIGFEISEIDRNIMRERMRQGGGMGGRSRSGGIGGGRSGGGMGGGRSGGMGGSRPQMPEPLKIWATVQLASQNELVNQ